MHSNSLAHPHHWGRSSESTFIARLRKESALGTVTGNSTGSVVLVLLVAFGLGSLVERSLLVFTVIKLVATPWNIDGRGGVAFRADAIAPVPTASASPARASAAAAAGAS